MQMAHALAGCVQAHASRAEDAYRISACANGEDDKETWKHITQASLMAFAGINCRSAADELALISWQATRLARRARRAGLPGPDPREGDVGSGDTLMRTIRLTAAALSGMLKAAHAAADPRAGKTATSPWPGRAWSRRWPRSRPPPGDADLHTAAGELMAMGD